jgi:hypothetical protein
MIENDYQLSVRLRSIITKFDNGFFSYQDVKTKIAEAIDERIANLPQPEPSADKQSLLDTITPNGKAMRFSVDGEGAFSLEELIDANEDFDIIIVNQLLSLRVGGIYSPGLGADVERVV